MLGGWGEGLSFYLPSGVEGVRGGLSFYLTFPLPLALFRLTFRPPLLPMPYLPPLLLLPCLLPPRRTNHMSHLRPPPPLQPGPLLRWRTPPGAHPPGAGLLTRATGVALVCLAPAPAWAASGSRRSPRVPSSLLALHLMSCQSTWP